VSSEPTETPDDRAALIKRAESGDRNAVKELKNLYRDQPGEFAEIACSPVTRIARRLIAQSLCGKKRENPLIEAGLLDRAETMEKDLAGPNANPIESLLASRIATCWLDCHILDALTKNCMENGGSWRAITFFDKTRHRAHDRLMSSIKTLAYVRKVNLNGLLIRVNHVHHDQAGAPTASSSHRWSILWPATS